jgi:putative holliday junction resolvase
MPGRDGYVLAFDFGLRHIGVAVGQHITATASPITTVRARDGKPDWAALKDLVAEWAPSRLLVGLPLNMNGSESPMAERAREFAGVLARRTGLPVSLVDERLTSRAARELGDHDNHQRAAVLIAETWLYDQRR